MLSTFEVIAEPSRRRILDLLCAQERTVGELVTALSLNQPAVSKHLRVLKEAQLVEAQASANQRIYRLRAEPLLELDAWLTQFRKHWSTRLDALGAHLDDIAARERDRVRKLQRPTKTRRTPRRSR
jgi:DNA-binding transcriptional ArsR family regulator